MKLTMDVSYTHVDFEGDKQLKELVERAFHQYLGVKQEGYMYSPAYKSGHWDGLIQFYEKDNQQFPTGIVNKAEAVLGELQNHYNFQFTIEDNRPDAFMELEELPDDIILTDSGVGEITLRDYQYDALAAIIRKQTGIVHLATNAGKCLPASVRVLTKGGYKTVEQIFEENGTPVENKEEVVIAKDLTLINRYGELEKASHLTFNGTRELLEVTTATGLSQKATHNHPLLVGTGNTASVSSVQETEWVTMENLNVGDKLVTRPDSEGEYLLDPIVAIKEAPPEPTFDVHMPKTHSFIAESIVNHNTEIAAGIIQQLQPRLERGETIAFFTSASAIFNQSAARLEERLGIKVGKYGNGKKDIKQVNVVMIPTISSALKVDPEKGLKLTAKERIVKKMAKDIAPKFLEGVNQRQLMKAYLLNFEPKTKADEDLIMELDKVVYESESDAKVKFKLNSYIVEYQKLIEKKNKKIFDKYNEAVEFLDNIAVMIADECLVADTLITKEDGGWAPIQDFKVGDKIKGGTISDIKKVTQPTMKIKHKYGLLEGSLTHPTFVISKEHYEARNYTPVEMPFFKIREGDYLLVDKSINHTTKTSWTPKQLEFVALIQADGHLDKDSNRVKVNVSKDVEWYQEKFAKGVYSFNPEAEIKKSIDVRGNTTFWTTDPTIGNILVNIFEVAKGKKSGSIKINKEIQYAPLESIKSYIAMLYSCEGDLDETTNSSRLSFNTTSRILADGLSLLLRKFDILPNTQKIARKTRKDNDIHRVVVGGEAYNKFIDTFDVIDRKKGQRNGGVIQTHTTIWDYALSKVGKIEVEEKEVELYDFTTTSGTFLANGTLTHNCHHSTSDTWYRALMMCSNAQYRVGLTGSIDTEDKVLVQRMQSIFGEVAARTTNDFLIGEGHSAKPKIMITPIMATMIEGEVVDISNEGIYMTAYEKGIVNNEYRNLLIAKITEMWYNDNKGILIIVNRIDHGNSISELLSGLDIKHEFVHGEMEVPEREKRLTAMKNGELKVMIATSLIDEGVDISGIDALIMAAGGKSLRQTLQRIGRVLRKKKTGENVATVFDFEDRTHKHLLKHAKKRKAIYEDEGFDIQYLD